MPRTTAANPVVKFVVSRPSADVTVSAESTIDDEHRYADVTLSFTEGSEPRAVLYSDETMAVDVAHDDVSGTTVTLHASVETITLLSQALSEALTRARVLELEAASVASEAFQRELSVA